MALFFFLGFAFPLCAEDLPSSSLFHFDQVWRTESGSSFQLKELRGKKTVMAFVYTRCKSVCPLIIQNLYKLEKALPEPQLQGLRFLLVSLDPARDTPEAIRGFVEGYQLDLQRWTVLTGNPDALRSLSAAAGFNFKPTSDGEFVHQNTIFLLDEEGQMVSHYPNLSSAADELTADLTQVALQSHSDETLLEAP